MKKALLGNSFKAVSYHLWKHCNMRCKFCYATFQDIAKDYLPKGHQTKAETLQMVRYLAEAGVEKITFAGGEPTLCKWLPELVIEAKAQGLTTSIITNGSRITDAYLDRFEGKLDWMGISIDSLDGNVNLMTGRAIVGKHAIDADWYYQLIEMVKGRGLKFKLNTVVHALNAEEDMNGFIDEVQPARWKVFQVLPIEGQNSGSVEELLISKTRFENFVARHDHQKALVPEDNESMTGSYLLIDPAGRLFENSKGKHTYSRQVAEVGMAEALRDINLNLDRFYARGGVYNW